MDGSRRRAHLNLVDSSRQLFELDLGATVVTDGGSMLGAGSSDNPAISNAPRLINMYGITETTVHVTYRRITRSDLDHAGKSAIGSPIPDLAVYLLDESGQAEVRPGQVGEIYVGGAGVARGYLNRPELDAERFLPDPFSAAVGARMYRSAHSAVPAPMASLPTPAALTASSRFAATASSPLRWRLASAAGLVWGTRLWSHETTAMETSDSWRTWFIQRAAGTAIATSSLRCALSRRCLPSGAHPTFELHGA